MNEKNSLTKNLKIELCTTSVFSIQLAKELNFDRIELCENLIQGGITPSAGRLYYALEQGLDTHVLIRPRPGGFYYKKEEIDIMIQDIRFVKDAGAKGIAVGVLDEFGAIDRGILERFVQEAKGMDVTFHRAFDDCVWDWEKSLDVLIDCGVNRVLTSGIARNVTLGLPILKKMKTYAQQRIEIMPGGGVNAANVVQLIREVEPDAIHFSGAVKTVVDENSLFTESFLAIDENRVKRILEAIEQIEN